MVRPVAGTITQHQVIVIRALLLLALGTEYVCHIHFTFAVIGGCGDGRTRVNLLTVPAQWGKCEVGDCHECTGHERKELQILAADSPMLESDYCCQPQMTLLFSRTASS